MTDILDKYAPIAARHDQLLAVGPDPLGVCLEEIYSATEARINGRRTILAGTNNYMGVTFEPECLEAAEAAVRNHGTGTTGSRIANGTYGAHRDLEQALARFMGREKAIVFSTGYQANLGMIAGLAGPQDVILLDADSHSSIYDGCRLSGATLVRFRHNDPGDLDKRLERLGDEGESRLIIIEGIYSMLGDRAPVAEFAEVKRKHGAYLLVDEAHSLGVMGANGRGAAEAEGVDEEVDFYVGTFSKSLGSIGGFGASNHPRFDVLRFCSRPYMFTASPSPANVASALAALKLLERDPGRRDRLWNNAQAIYDGLSKIGFEICAPMSPIIAVRLPDEQSAVFAWNRLLEHGVYVNLALPPGTPAGVFLLRCSVSAAHTPEQVEDFCHRFELVAQELAAMGDAKTAVAAGA